MANMLAAHPSTYVPRRETAIFFRPWPRAAFRYNELKWRARKEGKRYLVEKTPRHVHKLELIERLAPRARVVIPVRDGRDVVASIVKRGMAIDDAIERWIEDNSIVLEHRDRGNVVVYRHEDLIVESAATLRRVCEGAEIPYRDEMLSYHEQERLWFGVDRVSPADPGEDHEEHRNWQVNQPIFDNRGRWKKELTGEQLEPLLEGRGGELMRAFGYLE